MCECLCVNKLFYYILQGIFSTRTPQFCALHNWFCNFKLRQTAMTTLELSLSMSPDHVPANKAHWTNAGPPSAKLVQHCFNVSCLPGRWYCIGRSPPPCVKQTGVEGSLSSPANTIHCPIVGSMLGQRRRRWINIEPALGHCLVFAGRQGTVTRDYLCPDAMLF